MIDIELFRALYPEDEWSSPLNSNLIDFCQAIHDFNGAIQHVDTLEIGYDCPAYRRGKCVRGDGCIAEKFGIRVVNHQSN